MVLDSIVGPYYGTVPIKIVIHTVRWSKNLFHFFQRTGTVLPYDWGTSGRITVAGSIKCTYALLYQASK